ncbi:MAG: DUF3616 domain-containing protein [Tahibacter sp.]
MPFSRRRSMCVSLLLLCLTPALMAAPFTPGNLVVYRVGNGSAALGSAATAVFLDEYTPAGALVQSLPMPTAIAGSNRRLTASGSATSEGLMTRSVDERYLVLSGYDATTGTASIAGTTASAVNRVVARVDASGAIDSSTALSDAYSANNLRGATSVDGSSFWVSGTASGTGGGVRYAPLGATTSTFLSSDVTNIRAVAIFDGQLMIGTSSGSSVRLGKVGNGVPTAGGQTIAALPGLPIGTGSPYAFVMLDRDPGVAGSDTLYVADDTPGNVYKYSLVGSSWVSNGSVSLTGVRALTGTVSGATAELYASAGAASNILSKLVDSAGYNVTIAVTPATVATGAANTVFRGVAFAPHIANAAPSLSGLPSAFSGVIADPTDSAALTGLSLHVADDATPASALQVTASSADTAVVPAAGLVLQSLGGGDYRLHVTPASVGYSQITVTVSDAESATSNLIVNYAASAGSVTPTSTIFPLGTADASTAQALDADSMLIADDENQVLRVYSRHASGAALGSYDATPALGLTQISGGVPREVDIEASARLGNRIYWMGSHSNSSSGSSRPNRYRLFATDVSGSGAATAFAFVGHYDNLRSDLISWDHDNVHGLGADHFGLQGGATIGTPPEADGGIGFNIEGMAFKPGSTVAYLGFRAPIVPSTARTRALLVPVSNLAGLVSGSALSASFGAPLQLDLDGRGIRELQCGPTGCLIIAGDSGAANNFKLYTWSGDAADLPVERGADLTGLNPEGLVALPNALDATSVLELVSDNGDTVYYNDGVIAKELPNANQRKFRVDRVALGVAIDRTPDAFHFIDRVGVQRGAMVESAPVTVTGISVAVPLAIESCSGGNCAWSVNGGAFTDAPGSVVDNDIIVVRQRAGSGAEDSVSLLLNIGGVSDAFEVQSVGLPTALDAIGGGAQITTLSSAFAIPLSVRVLDHLGQPVAGIAVTFAAPANGASANFIGILSQTVSSGDDGVASSSPPVANAIPGGYSVRASVSGELSTDLGLTNLGPLLNLSATQLDFGSVRLDRSAAPQTIELNNDGNLPLTIVNVSINGDFQILTSTCNGAVAAGAHCTFDVQFSPMALGVRKAQIGIVSDVASSPDHVSLIGIGAPRDVGLNLGMDDGRRTLAPGDTVHYRMSVGNTGPDNAPGISFDAAPLSALSDCLWASSASGNAAGNSAGPNAGAIHEAALLLPPGGRIDYALSCRVAANAPNGPLTLDGALGLPADVSDANHLDDTAQDTDTISDDLIFEDGWQLR